MGVHAAALADSLASADAIVLYAPPGLDWDAGAAVAHLGARAAVARDDASLLQATLEAATPGTRVLIMSNGSFGGLHKRLLDALEQRRPLLP
jgi:UDP-N-acetylmuramate: L-alanyl-gamma-D-glutamyl-meso-diaminopimelate ligase